jgi:hypothetical protein
MIRRALVLAFALALPGATLAASKPPAAAPAKSADIKRFFGEWRGTAKAMSETDEDFSSTNRDVALLIRPASSGGFVLSWSTVQRQKGDPAAPTEVTKSTTVDFIPTSDANRWQAKQQANVYAGGILYWARLDGDALTVTTFTIADDGRPEMQTYRRRIVSGRMKLEFSNVRDGEVQRVVSGELRRQ